MSSKDIQNYALGMIETKGLIGAIEAADAACKAAKVMLAGKEKVKGALINIKIVGEVAAVRTAVEAGAAAAQKVGHLVGSHVIPNPTAELAPYIFLIEEKSVEKPLDEDKPAINIVKKTETPVSADSTRDTIVASEPDDQISLTVYSEFEGSDDELLAQLEEMTVHELRRMARGVKGLSIFGREISKANKDKLIFEIMKSRRTK